MATEGLQTAGTACQPDLMGKLDSSSSLSGFFDRALRLKAEQLRHLCDNSGQLGWPDTEVKSSASAANTSTALARYNVAHMQLLSTLRDGEVYANVLRTATTLLTPIDVEDDEVAVEASKAFTEISDILAKNRGAMRSQRTDAWQFFLAEIYGQLMDYLTYMITCSRATHSERASLPWKASAEAQAANIILTVRRMDTSDPSIGAIANPAPLYIRLDPSRYEIRLLTIDHVQPSDNGSCELQCTLRTISLDQKPSYYAVSHRWDTSGNSEIVSVNGHGVQVSRNLVSAMQEFYKKKYRTFWIDSICINQDDQLERGQQVMLMGIIYSQASKVLAWLGRASHDSEIAMDLLGSDNEESSSPDSTELAAVQRLMTRSYWERAWIVQEVAKAKAVEVWCGSSHISWKVMSHKLRPDSELVPASTLKLFETLKRFRTMEQAARFGDRRTLLYGAILQSRHTKASDPRDKIYSLLALVSDGPDIVPIPSYLHNTLEVFADVARQLINCRSRAAVVMLIMPRRRPSCHPNWPSWLPFWAKLEEDLPPWSRFVLSRASNGYMHIAPDIMSLQDDLVLRINGQRVATIAAIARSVHDLASMNEESEVACDDPNDGTATEVQPESPQLRLNQLFAALSLAGASCRERGFRLGHSIRLPGEEELLLYSDLLSADPVRASKASISSPLTSKFPAEKLSTLKKLSNWLIANRDFRVGKSTLATQLRSFWDAVLRAKPIYFGNLYNSGAPDWILSCLIDSDRARCLAFMEQHNMVLAITTNNDFLVVRSATRVGDEVVWIRGPKVAMVLRAMKEGPNSDESYSVVGEVCTWGCREISEFAPHAPEDSPVELFHLR